MTTTNCIDCSTRLSSSNRASRNGAGSDYADMCIKCYDYAGAENEHNDEGHNDDVEGCPVCEGNAPTLRTGHTNTAPKTRSSHAACYAAGTHDKTREGRAACRATRKV